MNISSKATKVCCHPGCKAQYPICYLSRVSQAMEVSYNIYFLQYDRAYSDGTDLMVIPCTLHLSDRQPQVCSGPPLFPRTTTKPPRAATHVLATFHALLHKHVPVELSQLVPVGEMAEMNGDSLNRGKPSQAGHVETSVCI